MRLVINNGSLLKTSPPHAFAHGGSEHSLKIVQCSNFEMRTVKPGATGNDLTAEVSAVSSGLMMIPSAIFEASRP